VDVLAPGAEISTWDQSGGIGRVTGTSFASPQIAGLAAALLGRGVGGSAVRALLASTTAAAHDGAPYAAANGTGRVDALAAYQTWAARRAFSSVFPIGGNVVPTGGHLVGVEVLRYDPDPGVAPDDPSGLEATAGFSVTSGPGSVPGATTRPDDARGGRLVQLLGTVRTIGSDVADGSLVSGHPGEVFRAQPVRVLDESDSRFGRPTRSGRSTAAVLAYGRRSQLLTRIRLTVRDTVSVRASLPPAAGLSPFDPAAALCVWSPVGYGDVADGTELPDCVDGLGPAVDVSFKAPETGTYLVGTVAFDSRADGRHVVTTLVQSPTTARVRAPAYSSPTQRTDGFGYRYTVSGAGYANRVAGFDVQVAHRQRTRTGRWVTSPWRAVGARRAATQPVSELLRGARPGNTYLLRARAVDAVGNVGRWSPAVATDVPLDDRTRGVTWSRNAARVHCPESPTTGSVACYGRLATGVDRRQRPQAFTANLTTDTRRFGVLATRCPTCGTLTVYVDGRPRRTVSLHAATTRYRQMVYSSPLLTPTTRRHSLRLVARTTAGRYRIQVDGIRLTR
jgi:hypothetical protein